jgi:hypothetical protein
MRGRGHLGGKVNPHTAKLQVPQMATSYSPDRLSGRAGSLARRPLPCSIDRWLIAFLAAVSFAAVLRIGLRPSNTADGVAVVYAPWTTADEALVRAVGAGARFVRFGRFGFIAVVMPERADYADRALADSALLVVDPRVLAACLPTSVLDKADAHE